MGKLVIISKDKKNYKMEMFLDDEKICSLSSLDEKFFLTKEYTYSIYFFSRHSQNKSSVEKIDLSKNVLIEISQGFVNPKMNIHYLSDEELNKYEDKVFINIDNKEQSKNNDTSTFLNNKNQDILKDSLSSVGRVIVGGLVTFIGIFFLIIGSILFSDGNEDVKNDTNDNNNYSYTVDKQGLDENGIYTISGKVTNNTEKEVDGLQIEFKCYDENNNHLDTISSYTENLSAGDTWAYEVTTIFNTEKIKHCDFYQVTPYVELSEFH